MIALATERSLRPLGLGEVLDRAVTLCVANFVPLTLIFLVYAVPLAVIQFYATKDLAQIITVLTQAMQSPKTADSAALARQLNGVGSVNAWTPVLLLMTFFVYPLPAAALIVSAARFYLGRPASFAEAYRAALGRWPHLIGLNFMYGLAGGFLYLVAIVIIIVLALGIGFLYSASAAAGIGIGIIIGVAALLASLAFAIVAFLAWQVSTYSCVLEQLNFAVAFVRGLKRVFAGIGLRRSLIVGCAYAAIIIGVELVAALGEVVVIGVLHNTAFGTIYTTIVRIATAAFTTAFVAIFYFDLRVREEGLDLAMAAQAARIEAPSA